MEQVKSFKTKDGKLFTDRAEAEQHELMITIRGYLQTSGKGGSLSATDVALYLATHQDDIYNLLGKYRRTMAGVNSQKTKVIA